MPARYSPAVREFVEQTIAEAGSPEAALAMLEQAKAQMGADWPPEGDAVLEVLQEHIAGAGEGAPMERGSAAAPEMMRPAPPPR